MSQQPTVVQPVSHGIVAPTDVWRILRKRLWLVVACFVVIGLGGTGALIAWYFLAPFYTAEGQIEVEPGQGQAPAIVGPMVPERMAGTIELYIQAQVLAIRNDRVLTAALEKLGAEQTMYSGLSATYNLRRDLSVGYIPNSQNILVSLRGRNGEQIKAIVREVLAQYIAQLRDERSQLDADRQRELRTERDDLSKQLGELGRKLSDLRQETSIIVTDERSSEQVARLAALQHELTTAQVGLAEANAAWSQFQDLRKAAEEGKDLAPVLMAFPEMMAAMRQDQSLLGLSSQAARINEELQALKQRFGDKHETVIRAQAAMQTVQNDLQAKQQEILGQLFQQQAATLKSKYDQARSKEAELQARVAEARAAAVGAAKQSAEYRAKEDDYRRAQTLLSTVTDGLERMRITSALQRPDIRVASWPTIPQEPSEPRLLLYIPAVIIFSLLVGMGLCFLLEVIDTRLRTPADIVRQVGVPLLGSIPDLTEDDRLALDTNVALVSQTVPQSLMAEAFRQFRTNLLFASDRPVKSILITSPNPADGKSMCAANLAITVARGGAKVLLVEANFRRPCQARHFDVPDAVGLSNVLVGLNRVDEAIQATRIENLDVLVGGALPPSPAELLGSASMRQLVQQMAQKYDHVIIDGAPMLVVADNYLLAEMVDGVLLVCRAGENTRGMALRAVRQVLSLRAKLLGAVLNRIRATKGGYFRESFQAYYDYAGAACPTEVPPGPRKAARSAVS